MPRHLSKENEKWLSESLSLKELQDSKQDVFLETTSPERLLYILRAAGTHTLYQPILKKYTLSRKPNGVLLKIRKPEVKVKEHSQELVKMKQDSGSISTTPKTNIIEDKRDLFGVISYLVESKPESVEFTNLDIDNILIQQLTAFCNQNNYRITSTNPTLKIMRINGNLNEGQKNKEEG